MNNKAARAARSVRHPEDISLSRRRCRRVRRLVGNGLRPDSGRPPCGRLPCTISLCLVPFPDTFDTTTGGMAISGSCMDFEAVAVASSLVSIMIRATNTLVPTRPHSTSHGQPQMKHCIILYKEIQARFMFLFSNNFVESKASSAARERVYLHYKSKFAPGHHYSRLLNNAPLD